MLMIVSCHIHPPIHPFDFFEHVPFHMTESEFILYASAELLQMQNLHYL